VGADLGLTEREEEVLGHLAVGRRDREIAELLFISRKTVSVHVSNLLRKLEVPNRIEAGRIGQEHGLGRPLDVPT
jgi:DNA-binding NarL/FixJ family response regulator